MLLIILLFPDTRDQQTVICESTVRTESHNRMRGKKQGYDTKGLFLLIKEEVVAVATVAVAILFCRP
jgi:hypothetical protein